MFDAMIIVRTMLLSPPPLSLSHNSLVTYILIYTCSELERKLRFGYGVEENNNSKNYIPPTSTPCFFLPYCNKDDDDVHADGLLSIP